MSYPQKFLDLIAAKQFVEAARVAANLSFGQMTVLGDGATTTNYCIRMMTDVVEAAFVAGAWDQLRAIKDDPECARYLSDEMRLRIQDETPTLVMRIPALHRDGAGPAPTDFDDDAPTNPRSAVLG